MNSFNRGLGDADNQASPLADVDTAYPKDYIAYGIPKDFGSGPGLIPAGNFDDIQLLPPHETQIPDADLQPDMHLLKAAPLVDPSERIESIDGQPNDHGNPYYNTKGGVPPYYKVQNQFYPPGSRWNGPIGHDIVRYVKTGAYVKVKSGESPERQVRTNMGQPMMVRRSVMVTPRRIPYGVMEGMGDDPVVSLDTPSDATSPEVAATNAPASDWASTVVTNNQLAPTQTPAAKSSPTSQAAATAGSSVWDSISSLFSAAGKVAPSVIQSSAAQAIIKATNALAGKQVLAPGGAIPWYANPITWGFLAVIGGGAWYITSKSRPGSRRSRRR